jgi:predicted ATPase/DNA-binding SARP family transcriptional activator
MKPVWQISVFGQLRAECAGQVITRFRTRRAARLLAYLAYHRHRSHSREFLVELLWPRDDPPDDNPPDGDSPDDDLRRRRLTTELGSLRKQLEPPGFPRGSVLKAERESVGLRPAAVTTDVAQFRDALSAAERSRIRIERIDHLTRAVDLYRGRLLPDYDEHWIGEEQEPLHRECQAALQRLVSNLKEEGELERALEYAQRAVGLYPLEEEAHCEVISLCGALGRVEDARRQYHHLEGILQRDSGSSPSAGIRRLLSEIVDAQVPAPGRQASEEGGVRGGIRLAGAPSVPLRDYTGTLTLLLAEVDRTSPPGRPRGDAPADELNQLLQQKVDEHGGQLIGSKSEVLIAWFRTTDMAIAAAVDSHRATLSGSEPARMAPIPIRMALHTAEVHREDPGCPPLLYAKQLLLAAHAGQILCSEETATLFRGGGLTVRAAGLKFTELGYHFLRNEDAPERLYQVAYPKMPPWKFPPLRARPAYRSNLRPALSHFFGRETELSSLEALLQPGAPTRLVTVTGVAGAGKTRLALEAARGLAPAFHGAVWMVPLADLSGPHIADHILQQLNLPPSPGIDALAQVTAYLGRQPVLLVLDNFEHLMEEGTELLHALLERAPTLTCLVTSRQRLHLEPQTEFAVSPLAPPTGSEPLEALLGYASVRLFIDRAQRAKPDFQLTERNAAQVAELCRRLEGIPLAIELAAAQASVMVPAQMLREMNRRFEFLVNRRRDRSSHHVSLRTALDVSYRLLARELRCFLAGLSVFAGGWTVSTAEEVCEEPLAREYLAHLLDASLIRPEEGPGEMRFRMLETIREYAWEQLSPDDPAALGQRHMDCFLALVEREGEQSERLAVERDNFLRALKWASDNRPEAGVRLATRLRPFWIRCGQLTEGRRWLDWAVEISRRDAPAVRIEALLQAGNLARFQDDYPRAQAYFRRALVLQRKQPDREQVATTLSYMGDIARCCGQRRRALTLHRRSLELRRGLGDSRGIAWSLFNLGQLHYDQGELDAARCAFEESLSLFREAGDGAAAAFSLVNLGSVARSQGRYGEATALLEDASARIRDQYARAALLAECAQLARVQTDRPLESRLRRECLVLAQELGARRRIARCLEGISAMAAAGGRFVPAARLAGAAAALRTRIGSPLHHGERAEQRVWQASVISGVGRAAFTQAWSTGERLTVDEAIQEALSETLVLHDESGSETAA